MLLNIELGGTEGGRGGEVVKFPCVARMLVEGEKEVALGLNVRLAGA